MSMRPILGCALLSMSATPALAGTAATAAKPETATPAHWKVLDDYCVKCHNTVDWAGGVAFDALTAAEIPDQTQTWEKAVRKLQAGMMPPAGKPRPPRPELEGFINEVSSRLDQGQALHPVVGHVSAHRLNRTEYANAVRDFLAFDVDVATLLPADDATEGFDNVADVLNVSPTLVNAYISAAMKISRAALGDPTAPATLVKYSAPAGLSQQEHIEGLPLGTHGGILVTHNFPLDGQYEFRIAAGTGFRFAGPAGGPPPKIDVTINGERVATPDAHKFRVHINAGLQQIAVAMVDQRHSAGVDDLYSKTQPRRDDFENMTINGPFEATGVGDTPSRRAILVCQPSAQTEEEPCARRILTRLATRAFRRKVEPGDASIGELMSFYADARKTGDFESGLQAALARILADPQFLYRIEKPLQPLQANSPYLISNTELASRLSFFLWSSIPDETLIDLAARGRLSQPQVLEQQVRRMLAEPRAQALVDNFAGQWLRTRELRAAQPDDPQFDENLREAMRQETQLVFGKVMHEDRDVVELLDADYTFVNERLARHYGIADIRGSYMRQITLTRDSPRRGLLGQGSILTVTSAGNRTSPVQRGAWVMETLFGAPVPQPPPGVDQSLKEDPTLARPMTVRQRLEAHRANPTCASCHQIMDPIGFSLEHFDLDGRWRDLDGTAPIDSSGKLVDGTPLDSVQDLRTALLARSESFVTSLTEKMLMYALGRRIEPSDQPAIRHILRDSRHDHYRFSTLILGIVRSVPFQMNGPPPPAAPDGLRQAHLDTLHQ
jgi:hypothetical protein